MKVWSEANHPREQWDCQWQTIHFDVMQPRPVGDWLYNYNSKVQTSSYSLPREMSTVANASGGTIRWEAWATARGLDVERGYIHHSGFRKVYYTGTQWVYPGNMGDVKWREYAVSEMMGNHIQQESPWLYHGLGAGNRPYDVFPFYTYDLAFYLIPYDAVWYDIYNSDEYDGITLDENHLYVKGHYDLLVEFQAALAANSETNHTEVVPNYGSTSMLYYDATVTAQLAIVDHAQTQIFARSDTLDRVIFDSNLVKVQQAAGDKITTYSGYMDWDGVDYAPTDDGKELSNALFQLLQIESYVPARYVASEKSGRPELNSGYPASPNWEYNPMFRCGYLGNPIEDIQQSGPGDRLYSRQFENGIVYMFLKQAETDPPDQTDITIPVGAQRLNADADLVSPPPSPYTMNSNEGITIITGLPDFDKINLLFGTCAEEWPEESDPGETHVSLIREGIDNKDDSTWIQSDEDNMLDCFTFSFPSNLNKLCEFKQRIRANGTNGTEEPGIRGIFWAGGDAWKVSEVAFEEGWDNVEIPFRSLDLDQDTLSGGGQISLISLSASEFKRKINLDKIVIP